VTAVVGVDGSGLRSASAILYQHVAAKLERVADGLLPQGEREGDYGPTVGPVVTALLSAWQTDLRVAAAAAGQQAEAWNTAADAYEAADQHRAADIRAAGSVDVTR
jgi:hypothetical protein